MLESIRLHRYVLFFTIFASIFSGSFFSKVKTADPDNATGLGQLLYFTRYERSCRMTPIELRSDELLVAASSSRSALIATTLIFATQF